MGQRLPPDELELYHRVDEVLHYVWDPIGVGGCPEARDEYYAYLPHVYAMLTRDARSEEIIEFLAATEVHHIGLSDWQRALERATKVTCILEKYRDDIRARSSPA